MKKKFKIILASLITPIIATTPTLALVNANVNTNINPINPQDTPQPNNPQGTGDGGSSDGSGGDGDTITIPIPKTPPTVSPDFPQYKGIVERNLQQSVPKLIDDLTARFEKKISEENQKETLDAEGRLKKIENVLYLKQLVKFLQDEKQNIINNPKEYGLNFNLFDIVANNRNLNFVDFTYDGVAYNEIATGDAENSNYNYLISDNTVVKPSDFKPKRVNSKTINEIENLMRNYFVAGTQRIEGELFEKVNVPKFDESVSFNIDIFEDTTTPDPNKQPEDGKVGIKPPTIDGKQYTSWKDFFVEIIKKQFPKFDIEQNIEFFREEDPTPSPPPPPEPIPPIPPPPIPGLLPEVPLVPGEVIPPDTSIPIQRVEQFAPILLPQNSLLSVDEVIAEFNKNTTDAANGSDEVEMFYFDNPINTRFKYKVNSLRKDENDGKLIATVLIQDQNVEESKRIYNTHVETPQTNAYVFENTIQYNLYLQSRKLFVDFYEALGLDEKLNYSSLRNKTMQDGIFSMVNLAYESTKTDEFKKHHENLIKIYSQLLAASPADTSIISDATNEYLLNILSILASSKITLINDLPYWYFLADRYKSVVRDFFVLMFQNKTKYENELKQNGIDVNLVNELYLYLKKESSKLDAIALAQASSLDKYNDYYSMLANVKKISDGFNSLSLILNNLQPYTGDSEEDSQREVNRISTLQQATKKAEELMDEFKKPSQTALDVIGGVLIALSTIMFLAFSILWITKAKKIAKNKKLKKILTVLLVTAAIIIAVGIALVAVVI